MRTTGKKELSLLQGNKGFIERVLSRSSSVGVGAGAALPGRSTHYYAGVNVEVPFVWEEQPGKPKDPIDTDPVPLPLQRQLSLTESDRPSSYFNGETGRVPFQWELHPGKPIDLPEEEYLTAKRPDTPSPPPRRRARVYSPCTEREEEGFRPRLHHLNYNSSEEVKQSRSSPRPPPMLTLMIPNVCASPIGSARWMKDIFRRKLSKLSKKVRRVRSEPREGNPGKGRFRVSVSDRLDRYYFSNSDDEYTLPSSGSSNSKSSSSVESPVGSRRTVGPLVHSSKFRIFAKGLAKWVKL